MKTSFKMFALTSALAMTAFAQPNAPAPDPDAITVTIQAGARQKFAGFGAGLGNWGGDYQKLTQTERESLSRSLWHELKFNTLRMWLNLDQYAPTKGAHDMTQFRRCYVQSNIITDGRRHGLTTLLLAPDGMPSYLKTKREGGGNDYALKDESISDYAALIADFIKQLRDEDNVLVDATGVQNEPNDLDRIAPEQFPAVVKALRAALNARGLQSVQIIAPESANVDGVMYDTLDRLQKDAPAWNAMDGMASHSYNMAATENAAARIGGATGDNAKAYWMTEASANGPEAPGDALQATSLAARFLSDMNHRVTHWIHFIGFETPDPNDNATRIMAFTPNPLRVTIFQKYYFYQQLSSVFDVGAVFRKAQSDKDGEMTWTYGKKPRVTVAAARNPDDSWGIGVSNFTAPGFNDDPNDNNGYANGWKAHTFHVTIKVPELANVSNVVFSVHRSGAHLTNAEQGVIAMRKGEVTLDVGPLELVTLRLVGQGGAPGAFNTGAFNTGGFGGGF